MLSLRLLREKSPYWAPVSLLLVIAVVELAESHWSALTPWKGGGFGMFSTADSTEVRYLKAYLITDKDEIPVRIPTAFSRDQVLVRTWPDRASLASLADKMGQMSWFFGRGPETGLKAEINRKAFPELVMPSNRPRQVLARTQPDQLADEYEQVQPKAIRLELWRLYSSNRGMSLDAKLFMSVIHKLGDVKNTPLTSVSLVASGDRHLESTESQ